ncbi:MAG: DUF4827 domain-containing protein [Dysgonamonadaceae bacterium]|jgi:hypothetical protein|nr:DUF4827 domain-containing protein [Dysgonamonadaceae bacterium]
MRNLILFLGAVIALAIAIGACDDQKSMQEYLREEQQAIERFIQNKQIKVTESWPGYEAFEKDPLLYYKTSGSTYVYMHIVDKGDTARKVSPWVDEVQVRFNSLYYIKSYIAGDTTGLVYDNQYRGPLHFSYGNSLSYTEDGSGLPCVGWAIPLTPDFEGAVGEKAIIDLIIPSISGNSADNSSFRPVFYKNLEYKKFY